MIVFIDAKCIISCIVTHAGIAASVGRTFSRVSLSVCLSVCLLSNTKTAWSINTKLGTRILYSSRSACIDPVVKRSRSNGYENRHGRTVLVARATAVADVGSHVDTTAHAF